MCTSPLYIKRSKYRTTNSVALSAVDIVPCGSCPSCLVSKRDNLFPLIQTEQFFTNQSDGRTAYVTFTYNEKYIPYVEFNIEDYSQGKHLTVDYFRGTVNVNNNSRRLCVSYANYKDVQNFFKSIRKTLKRINPDFELRYIFASEYGTNNTCRPHFHSLIYLNKPLSDYFQKRSFKNFLSKYWKYGFISAGSQGLWVSGYSNTPSYYVSKYIVKGSNITEYPHYNKVNKFVNRWSDVFADYFKDLEFYTKRSLTSLVFSTFRLRNKIRKSIKFGHQQLPFIEQKLHDDSSDDFYFKPSALSKSIKLSDKLIRYYLHHLPADKLSTPLKNYLRIKVDNMLDMLSNGFLSKFNISRSDVLLYLLFSNKFPTYDIVEFYKENPNLQYFSLLEYISKSFLYVKHDTPISYSDVANFYHIQFFRELLSDKFEALDNALQSINISRQYSNLIQFSHFKK